MAGSEGISSMKPKSGSAPNSPPSARGVRPTPSMSKVESLSRLDPALLIGNKMVSDLKRLNGITTVQDQNGKSMLAVRADLVDLGDIDNALEMVKSMRRSESKADRHATIAEEMEKEKYKWELDLTKLSLHKVIAKGTFGTVHKGVYDGQEVAVKLLDWGEDSSMARGKLLELRKAFKQEVSVWSDLNHPNITQFIGACLGGEEGFLLPPVTSGADGGIKVGGNICCVVVEYLPGGTLKDFLIKNYKKKLPLKTVVRLALDLASGMEYLHSKRVVHRDTKTENLLLDKKGTVKITDFGVARIEAPDPLEMTGKTGTLGYMAPEVLNGQAYNHKADVYSFGIVLWEIYACDMPFPNMGIQEMAGVVTNGMRPHIPKICPSDLADIMKRCWDGVPSKRPSMREVTRMLEAIDLNKGKGMVPLDDIPTKNSCFCF